MKAENAASGVKGCDAVWPYDPTRAYLGLLEWAKLLLAERDALREALQPDLARNESGHCGCCARARAILSECPE